MPEMIKAVFGAGHGCGADCCASDLDRRLASESAHRLAACLRDREVDVGVEFEGEQHERVGAGG